MFSIAREDRSTWLAGVLLAPGLLALVWEPAMWLAGTWSDPSYASDGAWVAAAVAAMGVASVWSGPARPDPRARRWAWRLFLVTAAIRLAGRLLAVHTIGAIALVVDVAALALLLGVNRRPWALSPFALAALATLALPLEHLAQRLLAHPLQLLAASSAELVLTPWFPLLERQGTLLWHPQAPLAIDLPCSGARGIVLLTGIALALSCRRRAGAGRLAAGVLAVLGGAGLANTLRIVALFLGSVAGFPVIEEPWHTVLGSAALAIGTLPLLGVARAAPPRVPARSLELHWSEPARRRLHWASAAGLSALAVAVAFAPERPLDVSTAGAGPPLPVNAGDFSSASAALLEQELRYYARYGGGVQKRVYDDGTGTPHTALLVHTSAPLRHLHGPDRCLLGAGHRVSRLGVRAGRIPTTVYRSVAPDGSVWRVEASFVSASGKTAAGVSEVVWRWLERPQVAWSLVERISAWEVCEADPARCARLDAALFSALDLPGELAVPGREATPRQEGRPREDSSI